MNKFIEIKSIKIIDSKIVADIRIDGIDDRIVTSVSPNASDYICIDRIDAYVFGLIRFAMRNGYDFKSDLPISESLYYNLDNYFIDSLKSGRPELYRVKIYAPTIVDIAKDKNIVATGISCGVDSLYTIATHSQGKVPTSFELNTLCFFNVGSSMKSEDKLHTDLVQGRYELAYKFAQENNYNFISLESDIHLFIHRHSHEGYSHLDNHTFMGVFSVLILQNGISKYYYSSGYQITDFSVRENASAHYDPLILSAASTCTCSILSSGNTKSRFEKVKYLLTYPPSYNYLNVCVEHVQNDNICFKCIRTLLEIDAAGGKEALEKYRKVFDIDYYNNNRAYYLRRLYIDANLKKNHYYEEIYPCFTKEMTLWFKTKVIFSIIFNKLTHNAAKL